jgi:Txe/YoeB family toxin of Txe-Axe toxin-antitoxin module
MSTRRGCDNFRSHSFGCQKRIKQEKLEQIIKKQQGAFDKFLCKTKKNENDYKERESIQTEILNNISDNIIKSDQTIKKNKQGEQLSMEIYEVFSDNCSEPIKEKNDIEKLYSEFDDIGCWSVNINQNIRTAIIKCDPKKVLNFKFLVNEQNRKFNVSYNNWAMPMKSYLNMNELPLIIRQLQFGWN